MNEENWIEIEPTEMRKMWKKTKEKTKEMDKWSLDQKWK